MAVLAPQAVLQSGLQPSFTSAGAGGDSFVNDERVYLHVKNASASPVTVTINSFTPCSHGFDHDLTISVPATTGERLIGPFQANRFNNDNSMVSVTYSATASVTVAVIKL
ncbi:hypothetical protein Q5O89_16875 [Peribacillus frigoritolerans]|nr:hypothetical protein [Peribacillus frigoritolerans]